VIVVVVTIIVVVVGAVVVPEIQCYSINIKLVIEIKQRKSIVTIKELHRKNFKLFGFPIFQFKCT
jgi:hypothetical protein